MAVLRCPRPHQKQLKPSAVTACSLAQIEDTSIRICKVKKHRSNFHRPELPLPLPTLMLAYSAAAAARFTLARFTLARFTLARFTLTGFALAALATATACGAAVTATPAWTNV